MRRSPLMPPGGTCSLHLLSSGLAPLLRNRSVPSRRESLHLGPIYRAISTSDRARFLGGRQPLCGIGVMSSMLVIFSPQPLSARTADSRPGPGPPTRTSTFFRPCSCAATASLLGGDLRGERRALARAAEAATTRGRPGQRVALAVGDRDDRVVEGSMDMRDAVEHVLARLLRLFRSGRSVGCGGFLVGHLASVPL